MAEEGRVVKKARSRGACLVSGDQLGLGGGGGYLVEDTAVVGRHAMGVEKQALLESLEARNGCGDLDAVGEEVGQRGERSEQNQPEDDGDNDDQVAPPAHNL